jgi:hypothetical protein
MLGLELIEEVEPAGFEVGAARGRNLQQKNVEERKPRGNALRLAATWKTGSGSARAILTGQPAAPLVGVGELKCCASPWR